MRVWCVQPYDFRHMSSSYGSDELVLVLFVAFVRMICYDYGILF